MLLSVRSGAYIPYPVMDTILSLGLNDSTVEALSRNTGTGLALDYSRVAADVRRCVLKIEHDNFEGSDWVANSFKVRESRQLHCEELGNGNRRRYKRIMKRENSKVFPQDPHERLRSIKAVFAS